MKVFNNIVGLLCAITVIMFFFRLYMLVIDMFVLQKEWLGISNDFTFMFACIALVIFFFRSTIFDTKELNKQGYNALLNMKNASILAFVACMAKFVTALLKFFNQEASNAITAVYVSWECILWLSLAVYFFVYWKNKNMQLNISWLESIQLTSLRKILPSSSLSRKLKKWEKSDILKGCDDMVVKRVFRKKEVYIDLYWYVKRQGEDDEKLESFYTRCSPEAVERKIYEKEKEIVKYYATDATD